MKVSIFFLVMISLASNALSQDTLHPGETWTYTANYTVNESDICSCIKNNVTVLALDPCSKSVDSTDYAVVDIEYNPNLSLEKISNKNKVKVFPGDTISYTFYVKNTGDVNLTNISLEDVMIKDVRYVSGDENADNRLNPGETWIYDGSYVVDKDDLCHAIINTAIVKATDPCKDDLVRKATARVMTVCIQTICCSEGGDQDQINLGDQSAVGVHNSQAENTVKIVSSQTKG